MENGAVKLEGRFNSKGELQIPISDFRFWILKEPKARFQPEKGRFHLYVSYACPWAHRTLIVRALKGLESVIPVTVVYPVLNMEETWRFSTGCDDIQGEGMRPDPLHPNLRHIRELYQIAEPGYAGRCSVPVLWDSREETVVNNESSEIIRMFNGEFGEFADAAGNKLDLYPEELQPQIDQVNDWMYDGVNSGVYKAGMAKTQTAYSTAVKALFECLDRIEEHLAGTPGPYYFGSSLTEVDVRLYVTIIRFDTVYGHLFKANIKTIRHDYPHIHKWVRNLYWNNEAFRKTTNFEHIKKGYYRSMTFLNPAAIVPEGPTPEILSLDY